MFILSYLCFTPTIVPAAEGLSLMLRAEAVTSFQAGFSGSDGIESEERYSVYK